jgi:hypothetical protein
MGESKRRKQADPNYGKCQFRIERSQYTSNYLVMIGDVIADSAISREEAERLLEWHEAESKLRPPSRKVATDYHLFNQWVLQSPRLSSYPESTAEVIVLDREKRATTTELVTVTAQDIIEQLKHHA